MEQFHIRLLTCLLALLLLACTPPSPPGLRVATGDSGEGLEPHRRIIEQYQSSQPGLAIRLEPISGGDYYTRLLTQMASGDPPDVVHIGDEAVGLFMRRQALLPLEPDPSLYLPGVLEPGRYQGQQVLLPKDFTPMAVYLNLRLFRRAGLTPPGPDWTWDQMLTLARKLTHDGQWGLVFPGPRSGAAELVTALGGAELIRADGSYNFDSPEVLRALGRLRDLYLTDRVSPLPIDLGAFDGGNREFEQGRAAMLISGRWPLKSLQNNPLIDLALLPPPRDLTRANILYWAGLGITSQSQRPRQARQFLEFYAGRPGSQVWVDWALPSVKGVARPEDQFWLEELAHVRPRAYTRDPYWSEVGGPALGRLVEAMLLQPEQDLARLAHEANQRSEAQRQLRLSEDR